MKRFKQQILVPIDVIIATLNVILHLSMKLIPDTDATHNDSSIVCPILQIFASYWTITS